MLVAHILVLIRFNQSEPWGFRIYLFSLGPGIGGIPIYFKDSEPPAIEIGLFLAYIFSL